MLYWALIFLGAALVAGVLAFSGLVGTAARIGWGLYGVGLAIVLLRFFARKRFTS